MNVSRAEYMLLVTAMAQNLAGRGRTPSPAQLALAQKMTKVDLQHRKVSVVGGSASVDGIFARASMAGWSWEKFKRTASAVAPYALPVLIPGAVVTPLILRAMAVKKARDAEAVRATKLATEDWARRNVTKGRQREGVPAEGRQREAVPVDSADEQSLEVLGTDEREIAMQGGAAELGAMRRMGCCGMSGGSIPQPSYRAGIWQRAAKLAGGKTPGPREIFMAQRSVDRDLGRRGIAISIPGARPGRRTVR